MSNKFKRNGGKIENWTQIHLSEEDSVIVGTAYGDAYWRDGDSIRTSLIVEIRENEAETLNTIYQLGEKGVKSEEDIANITRYYREAFGYEL